jgi:predicted secreted protein
MRLHPTAQSTIRSHANPPRNTVAGYAWLLCTDKSRQVAAAHQTPALRKEA